MTAYTYSYTVKTSSGELVGNLTEEEKDQYISQGATLVSTIRNREVEEEGIDINIAPNLSVDANDTSCYFLQITGEANKCTTGHESEFIITPGNNNQYVSDYHNLDSFDVDE